MQSRDWDELRRLMSIARQQNLLGEALQAVAAMSGGAGSGGMDSALGGMTDASKRRVPDDDEDWEAVEGQEPLISAAEVAAFLEANNAVPIDYENVDQRIPLLKGVASGRDWGSTVVTMAKFQDGRTTFEDIARTALGGNTDHIKYLSWIKERFKKQISDEPASQGPDLAAYLYYVKFKPPVVHPHGYHRTYRQGPVFDN
eukprot:symbB.v1.2.007034.t1/scaffold428.1/size206322/9